MNLSY